MTTIQGRHRAPMTYPTVMLEAIARQMAPQPGAPADVVIRHMEAIFTNGKRGRHMAIPPTHTRNLVGFRALTSELVEVTR